MEWISSYRPQAQIHGHRRLEEVLEFAIGNPVLVGYLAYIVGLVMAIAVVKATETGEPAQAARIHRKKGLAINRTAQSR